MIASLLVCLALTLPAALARPDWRVINGTEPSLFEFKSMVSIWMNNKHSCGGTLVDDDTVLTAAHCFSMIHRPQDYDMHVRINAHDFQNPVSGKERHVRVTRVITHPRWNLWRLEYDYLLLKLAEKVPESSTVQYSPLPEHEGKEPTQPGDRCYVVGWGSLSPRGFPGTHLLQKGAMRIISNQECKAKGEEKRQFRNIGASNICTKSAYSSTSACKGDSGGPLFCYPRSQGGRMVQVGVVSFGNVPCGKHDMPVVFGRISHVLKWIKSYYRMSG